MTGDEDVNKLIYCNFLFFHNWKLRAKLFDKMVEWICLYMHASPFSGFKKKLFWAIGTFSFSTNTQNWQCSFLLYLRHMMLVNVKSDVSGYKRIAFQGCRLYWSILFLMVQLKQLAISIFLYCAEFVKNSFVDLLNQRDLICM